MMRILLLLYLITLGGCATKFLVPSNRFMTPETQGGAFRGQFEFQSTSAQQLKMRTDNNTLGNGVAYQKIPRTGYQFSTSFFDSIDFVWSHTASSTSLVGGKLQLVGASRTGNGTGHKLSFAYLFGGNKHSTKNDSAKFRLDGQELYLIYGYRISELLLPYISIVRSTYDYKVQLGPPAYPALAGAEDEITTVIDSINLGGELTYEMFFAKAECSYQKIDSTNTNVKTAINTGFSVGLSW